MSEDLRSVLHQIGKAPEEIVFPDGSRALLLPYGGRILGLYPRGSDENFLWTHPDLYSVKSAREFFDRDGWPNTGGDRIWLSPERELFIADLNRAWESYKVPKSVDPGRYVLEKRAEGVCLISRMVVEQLQAGKSAEVEVARSIIPAANPVRMEPSLCENVAYAGYVTTASLTFLSHAVEPAFAVGLWNLVQLPHGGELFLPTYGVPSPVVQFGEVGPSDIAAMPGMLRYRMSSNGIQKIGLTSRSVAGRAGYLRRRDNRLFELVVCNFAVNPSGRYGDIPWHDPEAEGYCFQACNVSDAGFGHFSEIEHHAPAIGADTGLNSCSDESQVWAFRGPEESIRNILNELTGIQTGSVS